MYVYIYNSLYVLALFLKHFQLYIDSNYPLLYPIVSLRVKVTMKLFLIEITFIGINF